MISARTIATCSAFLLLLTCHVRGQETDRSPFAVEFPELNSGRLTAPRTSLPDLSAVTTVRFWVLNPAAEEMDWGRIYVRINQKPANQICAQFSSADGKFLRCNLRLKPGFALSASVENLFEIEAKSLSGKPYFATFRASSEAPITPKTAAGPQRRNPLGFSGRKFAVVFGVSRYRYNEIGLLNLNYADDDADALAAWLRNEGGFFPDDILHLTNEAATLAGVRDSLTRFLNKAGDNDLVLFFFAGHGTPDPANPTVLYYLVYDSKIADLKNTALPMAELKRIMDTQLKSRRVVFFLDTCHSAGLSGREIVALGRGAGAGERAVATGDFDERILERVDVKNNVSQAATKMFASPGRAVLTSSDVNEASREGKAWGNGHGVFTWALLEGLKGKSDANGDRRITAEELFAFVRAKVRSETNAKQNPRLFSNLVGPLEITVIK